MKSQLHTLDLAVLMEHYGDSLLAYLPASCKSTAKKYREPTPLPITIKSKIKYVNVRPMIPNRMLWDRQTVFPDSTLRGPRREIRYIIKHKMFINLKLENNLSDYPHDLFRFAFAGGRPVPPSNLRRVSLRANYQILRNDVQATVALVASRRLLVLKDKRKGSFNTYSLLYTCL